MNPREFREELAEAFIKGVEWSLQAPATEVEISRAGGINSIIMAEAQRYATQRILHNHNKLEPMK